MTLDELRRMAVAQTLFRPTTLARALASLGYVQADPIRAPARAQDLILRHRVAGYRAGDLEKRYARLAIEEDFFLNYGFVTRELQAMMHPRPNATVPADGGQPWPASRRRRARALLEFVAAKGTVHPRDVDRHFAHGRVTNYWGGSSSATTQLLDGLQYLGLLRVVGREAGTRLYAAREPSVGAAPKGRGPRLDALVDAVVRLHAPLPSKTLAYYVRRLRYATPQYRGDLTAALSRARERLVHARVDGVDWYWPKDAERAVDPHAERVRLLAPFDPIVHDRERFERLWGWAYRFEAYTPLAKRRFGYYALPLLWQARVIGWANLRVGDGGGLTPSIGYVSGRAPRERAFGAELDAELGRMREFLARQSDQ